MTKELKPFVSGSSLSRNGNYYILSVRCSEEEMEKTKRLIAAAPEMYDLIKKSLCVSRVWNLFPELNDYARELIAQIDGETKCNA